MKASQLRDLTRRYAEHGMSRDEYLAERKRLIDGVVAGEIELIYREQIPPERKRHTPAGRRWWQYMGGSLFLLALLVAALAAYFTGETPAQRNTDPNSEPAVALPEAGVELLANFMNRQDWSDEALRALETEWRSIPAFQKESARRSSEYRRLRNEMRRRLQEEEALAAAGAPEALLRVAQLKESATAIGFDGEF